MKYLKSSLSSAILLSFSAVAVQADTDSEMETLVVTGTKTPKLLSNSPVTVDVIEGETIALITKGTVADALEYIPGVTITRSPKDGYNVMMNGFDSKHVLILIDGQPVISPTGSSVDLDQINANDIMQIEVIRGAASVLYGSNAMGGVINIITSQEGKNSITYEIGSYIDDSVDDDNSAPFSQLVNLNLNKTVLGWNNKASFKYIDNSAFDYDESSIAQNAAAIEKKFVNLATSKEFGAYETELGYQYFEEAKSRVAGRVPGQSSLSYYRSDVEQHQFDYGFANTEDNWRINARHMSHEEGSGQSGGGRNADIKLNFIDGLKVFQFGSINPSDQEYGIEATVGFEANNESLGQTKDDGTVEVANKNRDNVSLYSQVNWIKKDYQVLAGVRAQEDSNFGFASAFRLSGMVNIGQGPNPDKLRIGFGQGYRVPDLKERFYYFDHSNLGYKVLGNANLKQESADNFNLSYESRGAVSDIDYSIMLSGHYSETEDEITTVQDAELSRQENLNISVYTNIDETIKSGGDIAVELNYNNWTANLNYSYVDAEDGDGTRLTGRPRHQVKSSFGYTFEQQQLNAIVYLVYQADEAYSVSFKGEEANAYTLVNFKLQQNLMEDFSWHLSLDNVFNEHQSPSAVNQGLFDPRPVSSREIRLGATYHF